MLYTAVFYRLLLMKGLALGLFFLAFYRNYIRISRSRLLYYSVNQP